MSVLKLGGMALALVLVGCGGGGSSGTGGTGTTTTLDFSPLTSAQLSAVAQTIKSRDLAARDVSVVYEENVSGVYKLRVVRHTVNGVAHYGVITVPTISVPRKLPVVAELDGLDDNNPPLDVSRKLVGIGAQVGQAIFVMPAYRGRTVRHAGQSWTAGGDFCDGFDGATDDTMALLNVLAAIEPLADMSRLLVRGGSRGGSVALLLGERDPRVTVVAAGSAPVDFYRQDAATAYGSFYRCQFITGKTPEQSRQAIVASSALHFPMLKSVSQVYLDHGGNDETVPVLNATEMNKRLVADGVKVDLVIYPGAGHDLGQVQAYAQRRDTIFYRFTQ